MKRAPSWFPATRRPYRQLRRLATATEDALTYGHSLTAADHASRAEQIARAYYGKASQ